MKRDIFHGKIRKEYYSYILVYMIFFLLLLVGVGALCVCAAIWGMKSNSMEERLFVSGATGHPSISQIREDQACIV